MKNLISKALLVCDFISFSQTEFSKGSFEKIFFFFSENVIKINVISWICQFWQKSYFAVEKCFNNKSKNSEWFAFSSKHRSYYCQVTSFIIFFMSQTTLKRVQRFCRFCCNQSCQSCYWIYFGIWTPAFFIVVSDFLHDRTANTVKSTRKSKIR